MSKDASQAGKSPPEEAALWKRLVAHRDREARTRLIERYLITAKTLAAVLYASRYDDTVEFQDYLQYARVGLLEAIDRYDPAKDVSFATFASYRIRGAILNGIEKSTELAMQRAQRRRLRRERLKALKEENPASREDAFGRMVDLTLDLAIGFLLEESGVWKGEAADRAADPYVSLEMKRLAERIGLLMAALPERERQIVHGHYFEHKDFGEIGAMLGVSRSRIAQLHTRALRLLRDGYKSLDRFDRRV